MRKTGGQAHCRCCGLGAALGAVARNNSLERRHAIRHDCGTWARLVEREICALQRDVDALSESAVRGAPGRVCVS